MIFNLRAKEMLGVIESNNTKLVGSYDSVLKINEFGGVCEQGENPTPTNPQEIKNSVVSGIKAHRKNFLQNSQVGTTKTSNGLTFTTNNDGIVIVNGTATADTTLTIKNVTLEKGNYILNGCPKGGAWNTHSIQYNFGKQDVGSGLAITVDSLITANVRILINKGTTLTNAVFKPMIRKADVIDDTYEPYRESSMTLSQPIELCGVGDVHDVITPHNIKRKFAKVVLDGSSDENWTKESGFDYVFRHRHELSNVISYSENQLSTHLLRANSYNESTAKEGYFAISSTSIIVNITGITTSPDLKSFLAENPMTFIFELAEPVIEELPQADQIALNSLQTFNGVTYVEFDSEVQPTFNCDYATSPVGAMALVSNAYNEIEKRFVTYNHEDGSAEFSGNIIGNAYVYGKILQAETIVHADGLHAWKGVTADTDVTAGYNITAGGNITADNNITAKNNIKAENNLTVENELKTKDLVITNLGLSDSTTQKVEWVWDAQLTRWVLCTVRASE